MFQFSLCNETKLPEVQRVVSDMVGARDDGKFTKVVSILGWAVSKMTNLH